jgi:putative molybdopterin biosynthesis protein
LEKFHVYAVKFMPELLTTEEAAAYLRLSERKLYELVANAAVPCSKVTGRWLFPKAELDHWVTAGWPARR